MLKTKKVCSVAMLIALTVVLSFLSGFLRVGNITKISLSFVPVYFAAAIYGGLTGGLVGALADIASYIINPTGPFLWPLSVIEFFYGFIFGILFYKDFQKKDNRGFNTYKVILCVLIRFLADLFLKTPVLIFAGYLPSEFIPSVILRLPSASVMAAIQFVILFLINRFSKKIVSSGRNLYE